MTGKIIKWGSIAVLAYAVVYFRGDFQRYLKMKRM